MATIQNYSKVVKLFKKLKCRCDEAIFCRMVYVTIFRKKVTQLDKYLRGVMKHYLGVAGLVVMSFYIFVRIIDEAGHYTAWWDYPHHTTIWNFMGTVSIFSVLHWANVCKFLKSDVEYIKSKE